MMVAKYKIPNIPELLKSFNSLKHEFSLEVYLKLR